MSKRKMTRREALAGLSKIAAVMAGAQGLAKGDLSAMARQLAPSAKTVDLNKIAGIKALSYDARVIKILLIPRHDVFISEFGRGPGELTKDQFGSTGCDFYVQSVNDSTCVEQNCGEMSGCIENSCGDQRCGKFGGCGGKNNCGNQHPLWTGACGVNNQIFSTQFLDRTMADPFIQALMKQLNVTTTSALSTELERMLTVRRQIIR
jgi:hypothetical protein